MPGKKPPLPNELWKQVGQFAPDRSLASLRAAATFGHQLDHEWQSRTFVPTRRDTWFAGDHGVFGNLRELVGGDSDDSEAEWPPAGHAPRTADGLQHWLLAQEPGRLEVHGTYFLYQGSGEITRRPSDGVLPDRPVGGVPPFPMRVLSPEWYGPHVMLVDLYTLFYGKPVEFVESAFASCVSALRGAAEAAIAQQSARPDSQLQELSVETNLNVPDLQRVCRAILEQQVFNVIRDQWGNDGSRLLEVRQTNEQRGPELRRRFPGNHDR